MFVFSVHVCVSVKFYACAGYNYNWSHHAAKIISRLMIGSYEAKKTQQPLSELFTSSTAKKLANALAKPP